MQRVQTRLLSGLIACAFSTGILGLVATGAQAKPATKTHTPRFVVVSGGTTTATPSAGTLAFLSAHGVTVTPVAPATASGGSVTFPVARGFGRVGKHAIRGILVHRGGLTLKNSTRSITLRHFVISKLGHATFLSARAGKHFVRVARATQLTVTRSGNTGTLSGQLRLTRQSARIINRLLGQHLVKAGNVLGTFTSVLTLG